MITINGRDIANMLLYTVQRMLLCGLSKALTFDHAFNQPQLENGELPGQHCLTQLILGYDFIDITAPNHYACSDIVACRANIVITNRVGGALSSTTHQNTCSTKFQFTCLITINGRDSA